MTYELIAYGSGEVLEHVFQALASLMNGKTGSLYQPLVRIGLMLGLFWSLASVVYGDRAQFLTHWMVPFYLVLTFFFAPTTKLIITDPVLNTKSAVDNVPWGLGALAGTVSKIGDSITRKIEATFALPDYLPYHKTGSVMASKLLSQLHTFQITNPDLKDTMKSFVNQCVVYEAMMGTKYTLDDLKHTSDLWTLISTNASQARAFPFKAPGVGADPQIISCAKGVKRLKPILEKEIQNGFQYYGDRIFGSSGKGRALLNPSEQMRQYLPGALAFMMNLKDSAEDILRQQMMMSAVTQGIQDKAGELGAGQGFGIQRAYQHQRAHKNIVAGIASHMFVGLKNTMEALIYASFIFLLPLAVLPLGWKFLSRWAGLVLWIQMWPPLYAILNMMANMALRSRSLGYSALRDGETGIALANSVGLMNLHGDMAAHAGFLSLAVGSLAYALIRGGSASFVHLAGHLSGPATMAAGRASEDFTSGNYSFGNLTQGTVQAHNATFGQETWSPSYAGGAFTQNDGSIARTTTLEGSQIVSVANSTLRSSLNWSESLSQSYSEQGSRATQLAENSLRSAAESEAEGYRNLLDLSSHHAHQTATQSSWATGKTTGVSQTLNTLDGLTEKFAQDHGISKDKAATLMGMAQVTVEGGFGFNVFGNGLSVKGTTSAQGTRQITESDRQLFSEAQDFMKQKNVQDTMNAAKSYAQEGRYSHLDDTGKRFVESSNASFDQSQQHRTEHSQHLSKATSFNQMATWAEHNAGSLNASLNQAYVDWLPHQPLPHSEGAMGLHEAETLLRSRPDLNRDYQRRFLEDHIAQNNTLDGRGMPSSGRELETAYQSPSVSSPLDHQAFDKVHQEAATAGLDQIFQVSNTAQKEVQRGLQYLQDSIEEQTDALTKESKIRQNLVQGGMND